MINLRATVYSSVHASVQSPEAKMAIKNSVTVSSASALPSLSHLEHMRNQRSWTAVPNQGNYLSGCQKETHCWTVCFLHVCVVWCLACLRANLGDWLYPVCLGDPDCLPCIWLRVCPTLWCLCIKIKRCSRHPLWHMPSPTLREELGCGGWRNGLWPVPHSRHLMRSCIRLWLLPRCCDGGGDLPTTGAAKCHRLCCGLRLPAQVSGPHQGPDDLPKTPHSGWHDQPRP